MSGVIPPIDPNLATLKAESEAEASAGIVNFVRRIYRAIVSEIHEIQANVEKHKADVAHNAVIARGALWNTGLAALIDLVEAFNSAVVSFTPATGRLAAITINQITGLGVDEKAVQKDFAGVANRKTIIDIGARFKPVIDNMFPVSDAAAKTKDRLNRAWALDNINAYFGTNLLFQLRSLTIATVASFTPYYQLRHLEGLHQTINWAFGFGWLSWSVMSSIMDVTTTKPLKEYYNRQIKPTDLSPAQATRALVCGLINDNLWNAILDNDGLRDDIRPILQDEATKKLTESDLTDLYEHGVYTYTQVYQEMRLQGYDDTRAKDKTDTAVLHRFWALQKELLNVYEAQFAHGLIQEQEFRQFLGTVYFSPEETNIEIEIAKRKATLTTTQRPKHITGSFNVTAPNQRAGGAAVMTWNIHNAKDVSIRSIGIVKESGEIVVYPTQTQTYYLDASSDTEQRTFEAVVVVPGTREAKRPTLTFSASPNNFSIGQPVELKWTSSNADTVVIDQVGPVPEAGVQVVYPFVSTIYTIRATNAQGTTIRQDAVFLKTPSLGDLDRLLPKVSFTISPGVVKAKQPRAEMKWIVTDATKVELVDPDGVAHEVGKEGLLIITATKSDIWELRATNAYGTTNRHEAIIWTAGEEDEPPVDPNLLPPQLTFTVSPQTAKPGEDLFIYWSIQLAPTGTLVLPDGTTRIVGISGSQTYTAPMVEGNYEFRLQSVNQNGPSALSLNVVVSTAQ